MFKAIFISFICSFFSLVSFSQLSNIDSARLLVQTFVETQAIPGLAVTVYHKGKIVWSEGFGFANVEHQIPVDPSKTKFRIGSISKTLTASALGVLMDENKVDLDIAIQNYVPEFPVKEHKVSLRQLGGHTAGIRHYLRDEFMISKHYPTIQSGLEIFQESPLLFEPGTKYQYSSYGWNLISAAIESIANQSFLNYVDKVVFKKLELENTVADYNSRIISNRTSFYFIGSNGLQNAPYVDNSYKWAGGGFLSTTEDLVKFALAHKQEGYLSEKTLKILQSPQKLVNGESTKYGIGWRTYPDEKGLTWIGHSGGSVGGTSILIMNSTNDIVVALTGNRGSIRYGRIHFDLGNIFLED